MPRKTRAAPSSRPRPPSFNEAAARCRGKRERPGAGALLEDASMRPRPDAAENVRTVRPGRIPADGASMRPRPDAAENAKLSLSDDWTYLPLQ